MVGVRAEGIGVRAGEGKSPSFFGRGNLRVFLGRGGGGPWSVATEARDGLAFGLGRSRG